MGLYPECGVEYDIVLRNGEKIVVVPISSADKRLLSSQYYLRRKSVYDAQLSKRPLTWSFKADGVDISLYPQEIEKLKVLLEKYASEVVEHGWYDVGKVNSTLGP